MTAHEFRVMGEFLFGECWQEPLALALEINPRTVQRWASGQNPVPINAADTVRQLVETKRQWLAT